MRPESWKRGIKISQSADGTGKEQTRGVLDQDNQDKIREVRQEDLDLFKRQHGLLSWNYISRFQR